MPEIGRVLIIIGGLIVLVGVVFVAGWRIPFLGRLPGDFSYDRGNFHVYFPLATGIVLSVALTIVLNLFFRGR